MKRKCSIFICSVLASVMVLTGCGQQAADSAQPNTETKEAQVSGDVQKEEGKTKLTYCTWNENQRDSIQATIDGFESEHPDITVELQITPWGEYWTKLEAAATSANMPDIVTMHTNQVERYVNGGILAELEDLTAYDEAFSYDHYEQGITELYQYDGKHYGVPKDKDCVVLVYNKKIFDNAGVAYPTNEWTWKDLEEAAAKLTDKENGIYGFNAYNNEQESWGNYLYQNGGSIIDEEQNISGLDDPKSIEAMEFFMNLNDKYSPSKEMMAETDAVTMFATGTIAMQPIGNWQLSYFTDNEMIRDDFQIAMLPSTENGGRATISNGLALSIPAACNNMEAAKLFLAYAGSQKGMEEAAKGPAIPCYQGVDAVWAAEHEDLYDTQVILDSLAFGKQLRGSELKNQWGEAMYSYVGKIFDGTMTVSDAFMQASVEMNEILSKENH